MKLNLLLSFVIMPIFSQARLHSESSSSRSLQLAAIEEQPNTSSSANNSTNATSLAFSIHAGSPSKFDRGNVPIPWNVLKYIPDGKITTIAVIHDDDDENTNSTTTTTKFVTFWSHRWHHYRTTGPASSPMQQFEEGHVIQFEENFDHKTEQWCSGGLWLMGVLPTRSNWVGIWHAEDHYTPLVENPDRYAWKSIGVSISTDQGLTWTKPRQIITAHANKPSQPAWGGAGDCAAVYDSQNQRIVILFTEKNDWNAGLMAAMTTDLEDLQGWKKWNGTEFASDGLGGYGEPLSELKRQAGANPSLQWNNYLQKWLMVWHSWNGNLVYSSSHDLVNWDEPQTLVTPSDDQSKTWYPTLLDPSNGDSPGDKELLLYYAAFPKDPGMREMYVRSVTLE